MDHCVLRSHSYARRQHSIVQGLGLGKVKSRAGTPAIRASMPGNLTSQEIEKQLPNRIWLLKHGDVTALLKDFDTRIGKSPGRDLCVGYWYNRILPPPNHQYRIGNGAQPSDNRIIYTGTLS